MLYICTCLWYYGLLLTTKFDTAIPTYIMYLDIQITYRQHIQVIYTYITYPHPTNQCM
jgi:hypothetical protein